MEFSPYATSETLRELWNPGRLLEERAAGMAGVISGLTLLPYYDRALLESFLADAARRRIREDLMGAQLLSALLRRLNPYLDSIGLPRDAGFRSEAALIAEKILGSVAGRTFRGDGPLGERLLARGAVKTDGEKADILIICAGAPPPPGGKALILFGSAPEARVEYRFSFEEIDEVTRAKVLRYHSRDMAKKIEELATAAALEVGAGGGWDMTRLLARIQEGINPHLRDIEAERAVQGFLERKLAALREDEAAGVAAFFGRILPGEERMGK